MTGIITDLTPVINDILGVRDSIGAVISPVFIVTRTWSGQQQGMGTFTDTQVPVLPSPQLVNLRSEFQALQGGSYAQGDIILKYVSKATFPLQSQVDGTAPAPNVEKFYLLDNKLYSVLSVKSDYLTWDVQIRKLAHSQGYGP